MATCHLAWFETDRPFVFEPFEREMPEDYRPRHELRPVYTLTPGLEELVFYNAARGGFQRAKGAEMIR